MIYEGDTFYYKGERFVNYGNGIIAHPMTGQFYGLTRDEGKYRAFGDSEKQFLLIYCAQKILEDIHEGTT